MPQATPFRDTLAAPIVDPDDSLLSRLRADSPGAFADLIRQYQGRVRAFIGGFIRDSNVVDDLAQETFLRALRDLGTFRGNSALATWVLGIARNRALEHLRADLRRRRREEHQWNQTLAERLLQRLEQSSDDDNRNANALEYLRRCLEKLSPRSGQLITEHYFGNRPLVDIARATGRKESTVRVELLRIRAALRDCLEKQTDVRGSA